MYTYITKQRCCANVRVVACTPSSRAGVRTRARRPTRPTAPGPSARALRAHLSPHSVRLTDGRWRRVPYGTPFFPTPKESEAPARASCPDDRWPSRRCQLGRRMMPMVAWVPGRAHGPLVGSALTGLRSADTGPTQPYCRGRSVHLVTVRTSSFKDDCWAGRSSRA